MTERKPGRPPQVEWPSCKIHQCSNTTKGGAHGFCHSHYVSARRGEFDLQTGKRLREPQRVASYGDGALCSVQGCGRRPKALGLCQAHWLAQTHGRELGPLRKRSVKAAIPCMMYRCNERATSKDMCQRHAHLRDRGRISEHGEPLRDAYKGGKKHYPGPIRNGYGYILVVAPDGYTGRTKDGRVLEHRLVMEQQLGRLLEDWELVHHINGIRSDNRPENLQILDGRKGHGEGHPPGHGVTLVEAQRALEYFKANHPEEYARLTKGQRG